MTDVHLLPEAPKGAVGALARELGLCRPLATVLWNRGLRDGEQARRWLEPDVRAITDPFRFQDMEKSVARVQDALRRRERILIHGDYDVDGLTGTVLLLSFLKLVGTDVDYHIPAREDGYSFSEASIEKIRAGGFSLCISVDNGTAAVAEVDRIQRGGCDVIVTDHHHAGPEVAPAFATLNPRLEGSGYPFPHLAGCAVAFKLAWGIAQSFSTRHIVADELRTFLVDAAGLVALGSVADVVPLIGENRTLVRVGLKALRASAKPGIRALIDILGPDSPDLFAEDISFRLGPRLNAAGRMDHASLAVRMLCATSYGEARKLAGKLEQLNRARQEVEAEITAAAMRQLDADPALDRRRVLLAWGEGWHVGVVGIVAARLADHYHRPAIVLAVQNGRARGSGRSHGGLDLKRLLEHAQGPLSRFGGHAAAVGLELASDRLDELATEIAAAAEHFPPVRPDAVQVDARVSLADWHAADVRRLRDFRPFGPGNPPPCFLAEPVRFGTGMRRVGPGNRGLAFTVLQDGVARKALAPQLGARVEEFLRRPEPWRIAYTPRLAPRTDGSPIEIHVHAIEGPGSCRAEGREAAGKPRDREAEPGDPSVR